MHRWTPSTLHLESRWFQRGDSCIGDWLWPSKRHDAATISHDDQLRLICLPCLMKTRRVELKLGDILALFPRTNSVDDRRVTTNVRLTDQAGNPICQNSYPPREINQVGREVVNATSETN
ncbi:hypothetical protein D5086_002311 [Populus alba]|uniref:Uncharacterized protein n=1 Tax=Populus alba TaxID=43335 RepID=A0ACC4D192_POPAL